MSLRSKIKSNSTKVEVKPKSVLKSSKTKSFSMVYFFGLLGLVLLIVSAYYEYYMKNTSKSSSESSFTEIPSENINEQSSSVPITVNTDHCTPGDKQCIAEAVAAATSADAVIPKSANVDGKPREAVKECIDRYPTECKDFAKNGQCPEYPGWNTINCPKSCGFCHLRDPTIRCSHEALNTTAEPVFPDGSLTAILSDIPNRFSGVYDIIVHSTDPWILTFEDFVTDKEIEELVGSVKKWERSTDSGSLNEYGEQGRILSQGRTSSNSWCDVDCEANPYVKNIYRKIEEVTQVPQTNYESLQILRYEVGQYYQVHHDMSDEDNKLMCGPRILTMFLYLSDVEEGGETSFPYLNISIKPKKGRALLWPSVYDRNGLSEQDPRTHHQALSVTKGLKFAANAWLHSHDYVIANKWGCTGSFADL